MKKRIAIVSTILVVALIAVFAFAACTPSADSLKKKYEDAGYSVTVFETEDIEGLPGGVDIEIEEGDIKYVLNAVPKGLVGGIVGTISDTVTVIAFNDSSIAKDFKAKYEELLEKSGIEEAEKGGIKIKGGAVAFGIGEAYEMF